MKPIDPLLGTGTTEAGLRLRMRQEALAKKMREEGKSLLAGTAYKPELTVAVKRPRARRKAKVVKLRRVA